MAVLSSAREKKRKVAQAGQDPALGDLDGDLQPGLILGRLGRAARIAGAPQWPAISA